jgi:hypothetical protein
VSQPAAGPPAGHSPDPPAVLIWLRADGGEVEFPLLASPLLVGRDEGADIRVDEPLVSRAHARIERRGPSFFVLDLGSTNRTRVNGEPVSERELRDGDEVRFARARCRFVKPPVDPVGAGV